MLTRDIRLCSNLQNLNSWPRPHYTYTGTAHELYPFGPCFLIPNHVKKFLTECSGQTPFFSFSKNMTLIWNMLLVNFLFFFKFSIFMWRCSSSITSCMRYSFVFEICSDFALRYAPCRIIFGSSPERDERKFGREKVKWVWITSQFIERWSRFYQFARKKQIGWACRHAIHNIINNSGEQLQIAHASSFWHVCF